MADDNEKFDILEKLDFQVKDGNLYVRISGKIVLGEDSRRKLGELIQENVEELNEHGGINCPVHMSINGLKVQIKGLATDIGGFISIYL